MATPATDPINGVSPERVPRSSSFEIKLWSLTHRAFDTLQSARALSLEECLSTLGMALRGEGQWVEGLHFRLAGFGRWFQRTVLRSMNRINGECGNGSDE